MDHKKSRILRLRHYILMMALFAVTLSFLSTGSIFAQTGAPPPPEEPVISPPAGTTVVEPVVPAIPPANIPPVTGDGVLVVIPETPDGGVAPINFTLDDVTDSPIDDAAATLLVPASEDGDLAVVIQPLQQDSSGLPEPLPEAEPGTIQLVFSIDIYSANGDIIHVHEEPLVFALDLPDGVDPSSLVLLHYNEVTGEYERLELIVDPLTGIVSALIYETSPFGLAIEPKPTTSEAVTAPEASETAQVAQASEVAQAVVPADSSTTDLSTTGTESTSQGWGLMALIGMIATGFALWYRREKEMS